VLRTEGRRLRQALGRDAGLEGGVVGARTGGGPVDQYWRPSGVPKGPDEVEWGRNGPALAQGRTAWPFHQRYGRLGRLFLPVFTYDPRNLEAPVSRIVSMSQRVLAGALMVALAACERSVTGPPEISSASQPRFAVVTNQTDRPFAFNVPGCGESVRVTGTFHFLLISTISPSGETLDRYHINADGTGVGRTSGASYTIHEVINATDHGRDGELRVSTGIDTEVLHGEGDVPDLFFRQHDQFTVNANGDVTVDFNNIESICS
jgi:hypothetical protein